MKSQIDQFTRDPNETQEHSAYVSAAASPLRTPARAFAAATKMGLRYGRFSAQDIEDMKAGRGYADSITDVMILWYLFNASKEAVMDALLHPTAAFARALDYADEQGLIPGSAAFIEVESKVSTVLREVQASTGIAPAPAAEEAPSPGAKKTRVKNG